MKTTSRAGRDNGHDSNNRKHINLALQGGGAHGAFTWGVLDRLLEDGRVGFDGISATSAGAMNAAVVAQGLMSGGPEVARKGLENFWRRISHMAGSSPLQPSWCDKLFGNWSMEWSPAYMALDIMSRMFSPYQLNPANINPLRDLLLDTIDFERLKNCTETRLFIAATNVRSGKVKLFETPEISVDVLLASACLPFLFQAVEVEGEHYWDGGYMGNPALFPLIYNCDSRDVVIVHINPIERPEVPTGARDILNRINEISFNSSLLRELRAVQFVTDLIDQGHVKNGHLKKMLIHSIEAQDVMSELGVSTKLNPDWGFLTHLRDCGREHAEQWLDANFDAIGEKSTVDIRARFL